MYAQLDPANHKSILDIQSEAYLKQSGSGKGKRKASPSGSDSDEDDEGMAVNADVDMEGLGADDDEGTSDVEMQPMAVSGGIEALREKLHSKMARLRRGGERAPNPWAREGDKDKDKDDLLDERRRQRAAMRERRRKETREKIRREEEMKTKGKKKDKEKADGRDKGNVTKVRPPYSLEDLNNTETYILLRHNYWYPITSTSLSKAHKHHSLLSPILLSQEQPRRATSSRPRPIPNKHCSS